MISLSLAVAMAADGYRLDAADPSERQSDMVVVTGTRTPRTIREAPVRTDVIGQELLTRAAPRNLADALDFLPAARSESNCQSCNTTEIQLLGLPGAELSSSVRIESAAGSESLPAASSAMTSYS